MESIKHNASIIEEIFSIFQLQKNTKSRVDLFGILDSISCQFSDIGSHNQLSNEQNGPNPSKHIRLHEMFHKENYLSLEKVIPMDKFANHYKMVF